MSVVVGWDDWHPGPTHGSTWEPFWNAPQPPKEHRIYGPFDNDLEVSVIRGLFTYGYREGLWEMAVMRAVPRQLLSGFFDSPSKTVLGHQTPEQVVEFVNRIANLPREVKPDPPAGDS